MPRGQSPKIVMEVVTTLIQAQRSILHSFENVDGTLADTELLRSLREAAYAMVDAVNECLLDGDGYLFDDDDGREPGDIFDGLDRSL